MKLLNGYIAHWVSRDGNVILSKNNSIFKYSSNDKQINEIIKLDYSYNLQNLLVKGLIKRLLRGGVHNIIKIDGRLIIFFDQRIIVVENNCIVSIYNIKTCKRPLNVCIHPISNHIYWGDYIASSERVPINIYCSTDSGASWKIIYTFPVNSIRHIHNIIYDEIRDIFFILTGDRDDESGIWMTRDFNKIEPMLIGKQKYRATSLIVKNDYMIIPTDTELEQNYIQKYIFDDKSLTQLFDIPSSSISAKKLASFSFVSTMVEPSIINTTKYSHVFVSENDTNWSKLFTVKKDMFSGKYFQYSSIQIPNYENAYDGEYFYFNLVNTKGMSGLLIFSRNEIRESLKI